jgi:EGF-like domain/Divergent InlB B-repeat domain
MTGYQLVDATCVNIDDCKAGSCTNGVCIDGLNAFTCTCSAGYDGTGSMACTKHDYCAGNPCGAGGTCTNQETSYTCACAPGYVLQNATCMIARYRVEGVASAGGAITSAVANAGSCAQNVCTVEHGGSVSFTATAQNGYGLAGWTGGCSPTSQNPLVASWGGVEQAGTCAAMFRPLIYSVEVQASGPGIATVSSSVTCKTSSSCSVPFGTAAQLSATEMKTSRFIGWTCNNGQTFTRPELDITPDKDVTCTASFVARVTMTVRPEPAGVADGRAIVGSGGALVCDSTQTLCTVDLGSTVTLDALSGGPIVFNRWIATATGTCPVAQPTLPTVKLVMNANYDCIAAFSAILN